MTQIKITLRDQFNFVYTLFEKPTVLVLLEMSYNFRCNKFELCGWFH